MTAVYSSGGLLNVLYIVSYTSSVAVVPVSFLKNTTVIMWLSLDFGMLMMPNQIIALSSLLGTSTGMYLQNILLICYANESTCFLMICVHFELV